MKTYSIGGHFGNKLRLPFMPRTKKKAEKLAYLRDALKNGPAQRIIQGLAQASDNYDETIACLKDCNDQPRLIHQAHVCTILELPRLKDVSDKELRHFYDVANQHI